MTVTHPTMDAQRSETFKAFDVTTLSDRTMRERRERGVRLGPLITTAAQGKKAHVRSLCFFSSFSQRARSPVARGHGHAACGGRHISPLVCSNSNSRRGRDATFRATQSVGRASSV